MIIQKMEVRKEKDYRERRKRDKRASGELRLKDKAAK